MQQADRRNSMSHKPGWRHREPVPARELQEAVVEVVANEWRLLLAPAGRETSLKSRVRSVAWWLITSVVPYCALVAYCVSPVSSVCL